MTRRAARVAALYDVHGNAAALQAVLDEARAEADLVVFGGDLAWGPFPREAVALAMDPGVPALYVRGNADRSVAALGEEMPEWVAEVTRWCHERLDEAQRAFLLDQSESVTVTVEGLGDVLFCHGSPRSDDESLTVLTPEARLRDAVAGVSAPVVVCGHTHMQFDRSAGATRVVNAGSVGMPYEGARGAYWALLAETVSLRRTDYDYDAASAAVAASGCPYAEEMAKDVLAPPERDAVARQFEGLAPE
ncbi:MAG TPA: metallophosphoesterase family protein [Actinomycetota bacterium]|nr:metallophosphoesterase family protein [Actinomycetota bacterium]